MNRKGYMLIEIILACVIGFGVAIFIINLTVKLKNKNDDKLVESLVATDQSIVTNKLMQYAMDEEKEFTCKIDIGDDGKSIYYTDKDDNKVLVDIVNEYADIGLIDCRNEYGKITINIPLTVPVQSGRDYDAQVEYKYQLSDIVKPNIELVVTDGTVYKKSNSGTIKISDNMGLKNGTYRIKYGWSDRTGYTCNNLTNSLIVEVTNNETLIEKIVTIDSQTGQGKLFVCNESTISDMFSNVIPAGNTISETMYLDNENPTCTLVVSGSNVTFETKADLFSGIAQYGMNKSGTAEYNSTENLSKEYSTKYNGYVKDNAGNTGTCDKTTEAAPVATNTNPGGSTPKCPAGTYYDYGLGYCNTPKVSQNPSPSKPKSDKCSGSVCKCYPSTCMALCIRSTICDG